MAPRGQHAGLRVKTSFLSGASRPSLLTFGVIYFLLLTIERSGVKISIASGVLKNAKQKSVELPKSRDVPDIFSSCYLPRSLYIGVFFIVLLV